jgi:poly [ADP-ribose] polymerase
MAAEASTKSKQAGPKQTNKKRAAAKRGNIYISSPTTTKKRKTDTQYVLDTSNVLGVVDPISNINGVIKILDNDPCDCMLVHLDSTNNTDKFFILQLILGVQNSFYVYSRWGHTGRSGQCLMQHFMDYEDAVKTYKKKFKEKTGLKWENRNEPPCGVSTKSFNRIMLRSKEGIKASNGSIG